MRKYIIIILLALASAPEVLAQSPTQSVGVGIAAPRQKFDINGSLYLKDTLFIEGIDSTFSRIPLLGVNSSGEVVKILTASGNVNSFNLLTYSLSDIGGEGDNVTDFNTGIPSKDYVISVAGYSFNHPVNLIVSGNQRNIPPLKIRIFEQNDTWHLNLDYAGSSSVNGNGTWTVTVLAVNKIVSKALPLIRIDMNRNQNGAAAAKPNGI